MDELALRNSRRITELENRQQVNYSNHSLEAHQLKNEGTTLKAVRGAVVSNAVIRAPNIPENLNEKLSELDESMDGIVETIDSKADKEHTHTIAEITDYEPTDISGKADKDHKHTDINYQITFRDRLLFKDYGKISFHQQESDLGRYVTNMDKYSLWNERTMSWVSMSTPQLTCDKIIWPLKETGDSYDVIERLNTTKALAESNQTAIEGKADIEHTHPDLETVIASKCDNGHTHKIAEITDYAPYDDRDVRFLITKHKNEHSIDCANLQNQITAIVDKQTNELKSGLEIYRIESQNGGGMWCDDDFKYRLIVEPSEENGDINFYIEYANPTVAVSICYPRIFIEHEGYTSEEDGYYHGTIRASNILGMLIDETRTSLAIHVEGNPIASGIYVNAEAILGVKPENNDKLITQGMLLDLMYPVGSIYTSMNPMSPAKRFGGTWEQIVDRFLYCANGSRELGGSKKITVEQLPAHTHEVTNQGWWATSWGEGTRHCISRKIQDEEHYPSDPAPIESVSGIKVTSTGSGEDYMPPYLTVYAWFRIE